MVLHLFPNEERREERLARSTRLLSILPSSPSKENPKTHSTFELIQTSTVIPSVFTTSLASSLKNVPCPTRFGFNSKSKA